MSVKNPKLLRNFSHRGYTIAAQTELYLDYLNSRWIVHGILEHEQSGDRIETRVEEDNPSDLYKKLEQEVDRLAVFSG